METIEVRHDALMQRALDLSEFFGHCQGLVDARNENYLNDFDVVLRLNELVATYEALRKQQ